MTLAPGRACFRPAPRSPAGYGAGEKVLADGCGKDVHEIHAAQRVEHSLEIIFVRAEYQRIIRTEHLQDDYRGGLIFTGGGGVTGCRSREDSPSLSYLFIISKQ